jgi:hypothetical protein
VTPAKLLKQVERELAKPGRAVGAGDVTVDIDRVCHAKQAKLVWALVLRKLRNIAALAGRQSGKSHGAALAVCLIAAAIPNVNLVYVTSTYGSCERMAYKPAIAHNRDHGLGGRPADMSITFPNGATIYFLGADNDKLIDRLRGIPNLVLVVIDEAGIYDPEKLKTMIEAVRPGLRPMAGTLCVMGTPSRAGEQGTWYDITQNQHFDQNRFDYRDNDRVPSFAAVEQLIDEELQAMGLTRDSAYFKREYLAVFAVDLREKVYQLTSDNLFDELPDEHETYATGGDLGVAANDALVCLGWSRARFGLIDVVDQELASGQDSIACADMVNAHDAKRNPIAIAMDPGGLGQKTILTVQRLYPKVPIREAQKPPIGVQVRYVNDLLQGTRGWRLRIKRGSQLAMELSRPTWVDGIVGGEIDEHGKHSDLIPALRYVAILALPILPQLKAPAMQHANEAAAVVANFQAAIAARFKGVPKQQRPPDSKTLYRRG